eukprot:30626-Hanusia_phi.AAC.1
MIKDLRTVQRVLPRRSRRGRPASRTGRQAAVRLPGTRTRYNTWQTPVFFCIIKSRAGNSGTIGEVLLWSVL